METGGDRIIEEPTLLKALLRVRHWQKRETFARQWDSVARTVDTQLVGCCPAHAQFYRWLSGNVRSMPHPDACRILEAMFPAWTVEQLFQPARLSRTKLLSNDTPGHNDNSLQGDGETSLVASRSKFSSVCESRSGVPPDRTGMQPGQIAFPGSSPASTSLTNDSPATSLLASIPHTFSAEILGGFWVTSYEYDATCHADISQLIPKHDRRVKIQNHPPHPRIEGRVSSFRNEIEAELANRHLVGYWKNINDAYYFGAIHLAVLPGETVMEGYYTCFLSDIQVVTARWKWVRLDSASLSGVDMSRVVLQEPRLIHTLIGEHSQHDTPLTLSAVTEGI